jgi:hypothetical protein
MLEGCLESEDLEFEIRDVYQQKLLASVSLPCQTFWNEPFAGKLTLHSTLRVGPNATKQCLRVEVRRLGARLETLGSQAADGSECDDNGVIMEQGESEEGEEMEVEEQASTGEEEADEVHEMNIGRGSHKQALENVLAARAASDTRAAELQVKIAEIKEAMNPAQLSLGQKLQILSSNLMSTGTAEPAFLEVGRPILGSSLVAKSKNVAVQTVEDNSEIEELHELDAELLKLDFELQKCDMQVTESMAQVECLHSNSVPKSLR